MFTDQSGNLRTLLPAVLPNVTGRRKSLDQRFRAKGKLDEGGGAEGSGLCCDGKETKDGENQRARKTKRARKKKAANKGQNHPPTPNHGSPPSE